MTIKIICRGEGVYKLFYTMYIDGAYFCQGGFADADDAALTEKSDLTMSFGRDYFEGADISRMSLDLSPFGQDDDREAGTTDVIAIPAEYGRTYVVEFSGDATHGFSASLAETR